MSPINSQVMIPYLRAWIDSEAQLPFKSAYHAQRVEWLRVVPFILMNVACIGIIFVGWSTAALVTASILFLVRSFALTAFYHRFFSHRAFRTSRLVQLVFALTGNASAREGPLWWAAHHRQNHRYVDTENDVHSPSQKGFLWSHITWFTTRANLRTRNEYVKDWLNYPELLWINRYNKLAPAVLAFSLYVFGATLSTYAPNWHTNGLQMVIWGFVVSTVILFHTTASINSFCHMFGSRRYDTPDTSRNNFVCSLLTLGEGWHNNHHYFAISAKQGFWWWEIDVTYYLLLLMSWLGLIWGLRPLPMNIREGLTGRLIDASWNRQKSALGKALKNDAHRHHWNRNFGSG